MSAWDIRPMDVSNWASESGGSTWVVTRAGSNPSILTKPPNSWGQSMSLLIIGKLAIEPVAPDTFPWSFMSARTLNQWTNLQAW